MFGHLPPLRRRLLQNPAYYDLEDASPEGLSEFMSSLVEDALQALADSGCVLVSSFCSILHICYSMLNRGSQVPSAVAVPCCLFEHSN